jgi:hypothetical protein
MNTNLSNTHDTSEQLFTEAPASWNTRYLDPSGFECRLTLRGETGHELLERAQGAITFLLNNGCTPCPKNGFHASEGHTAASSQPSNGSGNGQGSGWCPIHNCQMKKWEKDGRVWFSHQVNGEWCTGKPKRK